jgi:hypothetical protein
VYSDLLKNYRVGRSWNAEHVCSLNLTSISYNFLKKWRKVLKFRKLDEKRTITPKWIMGFTSTSQVSQILKCCIFLQFKMQKCAAFWDLPTLQFLTKFQYPFWSYFPFSSNFLNFNSFRPLFQKLSEIDVKL